MKYKILNPSALEKATAIFQLLPLSNSYAHDIPVQIKKWSETAMDVIQSLYDKIESKLQRCE
jgi:hypothetical protein